MSGTFMGVVLRKNIKLLRPACVFVTVLFVMLFLAHPAWAQNDEPPSVSESARERENILPNSYVGGTVAEVVILDRYHPWSKNRLPKLDAIAALRISGDYPTLDGATSAYPIYAAIANEVYEVDDKKELQQYLSCSRTSEAYNRIIRGEVDMIFVLQPSDEQLQSAKDAGVELHFTPIAKDAFVFFVNNHNPVSDLSIEQIQNIYLKKITNWREVGGDDRIILTYQRPANSGSQTAMIKDVMKGKELPPPLEREFRRGMVGVFFFAPPSSDAAQNRDYSESIGYSFRFFSEEMMQEVFWRKEELSARIQRYNAANRYQNELDSLNKIEPVKLLAIDGIAPSEENIRNGTYPFTVEVYAVTAGTKNPHVHELIDWLLSPQGQELIQKTGYVGAGASRD